MSNKNYKVTTALEIIGFKISEGSNSSESKDSNLNNSEQVKVIQSDRTVFKLN